MLLRIVIVERIEKMDIYLVFNVIVPVMLLVLVILGLRRALENKYHDGYRDGYSDCYKDGKTGKKDNAATN